MSNILTPPYPIFSDIDGSPLNEGFIYIGTAGLDPKENPIAIYWDKDKSQPAAQPLRTRNGYIVKEGLPANIYLDVEVCSFLIQNRNETPIAEKLQFYQFDGQFNPQVALDVITPKLMNIPNSSESPNSQTSAFQELVNYANSNGFKTISLNADYYIANPSVLAGMELTGSGSINGLQVGKKPPPVGTPLTPPTWLDMNLPFLPVYLGNNKWGVNIEPKTLDVAANAENRVNYYVNNVTGNNTNSGLTPALAVKDLGQAMNRIRVDQPENAVIWLDAGEYKRDMTWTSSQAPLNSNVSIQVKGGQAEIFTSFDALTWTASGNYYTTPRNGVNTVIDTRFRDNEGLYREYKKVGTLAEMKAGTWWTDGVTVAVWTIDYRQPDAKVHLMWDTQRFIWPAQKVLACNNISFFGGADGFLIQQPTNTVPVLFYDCVFAFTQSLNGLALKGGLSYSFNCRAYKNYRDNFNYHASNDGTIRGDAIEVNCISWRAGQTKGEFSNNNASTGHDGSRIMRIGGEYWFSEGPNVIDVGGCRTWNVGTTVRNSKHPIPGSTTDCDYYINEGGKLKLSYCNGGGSFRDVVVFKSDGSTFECEGWQGQTYKMSYL